MLTDMLTTMANGFVVSVTQDLVEVSCPCPARSRVQQLCTVRYKATEVITISPYKMIHNAENLHVSFRHRITMDILLQNTKNKMESSFLSYSARDNNCQDFVPAILQSNGLSNPRNVLFTKQSTGDLFSIDLR